MSLKKSDFFLRSMTRGAWLFFLCFQAFSVMGDPELSQAMLSAVGALPSATDELTMASALRGLSQQKEALSEAPAYEAGTPVIGDAPDKPASDISTAGPRTLTDAFPITKVEILGCEHFKGTLEKAFPTSPQRLYTQEDLATFLKTIYGTGLFKNVQLRVQGQTLVVSVQENTFISQIHFEGNGKSQENDLHKAIERVVRAGKVLTENNINEAKRIILMYYKTKGKFDTLVSAHKVVRNNGRVDLIFSIAQGNNAYIRALNFQGNASFSSRLLRKLIASKVARFWRIWKPRQERYCDELIHQQDVEALETFYKERGFLSVQISPYAELSPNGRDSYVTFVIQEGPRYECGATTITSALAHIDTSDLKKSIPWKKGEWLNEGLVRQVAKSFDGVLTAKGHPFVQITPHYSFYKTKTGQGANVELRLESAPPVYADEILIRGNAKTEEPVIRRLMLFSDGDPVNRYIITRTEQSLKSTGFFKSATLTDVGPGKAKDHRVFLLRVEEDNKIQGMVAGGLATDVGLFVRGNCAQDNFLGKGWRADLMAELGTRGWSLNSGLNVPNFMNRPIVAGVRLNIDSYTGFTRKENGILSAIKKDGMSSQYKNHSVGLAFTGRYSLARRISQGWVYDINRSFLRFQAEDRLSQYLKRNVEEEPLVWSSGLSHSLTYNKTHATRGLVRAGWFAQMTNRFTGLGGTTKYFFNSAKVGAFYGFGKEADYLLRLDAHYGILNPRGYVRFNNLTFLGEYAFPGFQMAGIGPRDTKTKDALGGKQFYTASAKFYVPIKIFNTGVQDSPLRLVTFVQSGSLWDPLFSGENIGSAGFKNRISAGGGILWTAPIMGGLQLGVIVSTALQKDSNDLTKRVLFVMGADF